MTPLLAFALLLLGTDGGPPAADASGDVDAGPAAADAGASSDPARFSLVTYGAEQMVLVVTPTWTSTQGTLSRFEKVGSKWMQVGGAVTVMVGADGLGWGLGLHPLGVGEPRKVDGDSRAVAGVYRLPMALLRVPLERMGALPITNPKGAVCVDEVKSGSYNRMLLPESNGADDGAVPKSTSGRALDRADGRYDVAVVVDHNGFGSLDVTPRKGRGTCTFLHVWRRKGSSTDGGTAMAREDLEELVRWLDPARKPVLVQMPKDQLLHKRGLWGIP